jgi:gliding motility-associated-like protein
VLTRSAVNTLFTEVYVSSEGEAMIGDDFQFPIGAFPAQLAVGQTQVVIPITVIIDGLTEGPETLILELASLAGVDDDVVNVEATIVDEYDVEIESPTDTIQWCRDVPLVLLANANTENIVWGPNEFLLDSLGTSATVVPVNSGWFYASVGDASCGDIDSVYLDLAIVEIFNEDTVYICLDSMGVVLLGSIDGLATEFEWVPSDSTLSDTNSLTPTATPGVTTTYILQSNIGVCTASDRVVVRVDSIPDDLHIDIAPPKPYYCAGEVVALFSPSFDTLLYPDIMFNWLPNPTFASPLNLLNAALILQDTTLYIRENKNNACYTRDSILIDVVPPSVPLSVTDTTLCPGEMFDVVVLADVMDPEWTPEEGLSCTKCLDPKVTVLGTPGMTLNYQFSAMIKECPVGASLTIQIPEQQQINIAGAQSVCDGEVVPLNITNLTGLSNFDWEITDGDATLSCDDCPNPVVTVLTNNPVTLVVTADTQSDEFCGAIGNITLESGEELHVTGSLRACAGSTITATTGNPDFTNIVWDIASGSEFLDISCSECPEPVVTVEGPGRLRFFAEIPNSDTCRVIGLIDVALHGPDATSIIVTPMGQIGQGAEAMAMLSVNPLPGSAMWVINGVSQSSTGTSIEFIASEELNIIEVTYINSKGCEQTDTLSFPTVPPSYMIPNAFTPNNDAKNDRFRIIINGNIVIDEFLIFNRWGQLVYEAPENDIEGWDGRFKNEEAASDTYVYKATVRFPDGRTELLKGDVALLR